MHFHFVEEPNPFTNPENGFSPVILVGVWPLKISYNGDEMGKAYQLACGEMMIFSPTTNNLKYGRQIESNTTWQKQQKRVLAVSGKNSGYKAERPNHNFGNETFAVVTLLYKAGVWREKALKEKNSKSKKLPRLIVPIHPSADTIRI